MDSKMAAVYANMQEILAALPAEYLIVDLWGVIHDGVYPYPGVKETLERLKQANKKILFLSNAPRRAQRAVETLTRMDISGEYYHFVLTSGEVTHDFVKKKYTSGSYYYIGPEKDAGLLADLPLTRTADAGKAKFAVVTGYDNDDSPYDEKKKDLDACIRHKLPLLCANPDFEVVRQNGVRVPCAGIIAAEYESMGGEVMYFGKPHEAVYNRARELFRNPPPEKILAIGDALETDIKGANGQGIRSVLVTCGIMAEKLGIEPGDMPAREVLKGLYDQEKIAATAAIPAFRF
ncbi:MAG: TIGR01459 family HAD-type hydrolase [Proteobacteria bacterium]|nr:TIGR01459 family HAD-type hydrolase [Pseudomonadota bacterium]